jgi:hypothetical protein
MKYYIKTNGNIAKRALGVMVFYLPSVNFKIVINVEFYNAIVNVTLNTKLSIFNP